MADGPGIEGSCEAGFEPVAEAFAQSFGPGELGASCAVSVDGELVVDLWGGHRDLDRRRRWERDTIVNLWSTTKMCAALCVLVLHDRAALSLDEPVATYWPEFGAALVLVRHVMAHTAGLPVFDEPPDDRAVFDWDACCAQLAGQPPRWAPGDGSGYHSETQGWLLGELVRRVDGRTLGTFFADEIARPRGIDLRIGIGADAGSDRIAEVSTAGAEMPASPDAELRERQRAASRRSLGLVNTRSWQRAELAASNGHGNARSVVQAMSPLATGGDGLLSPATIERIFEVQSDGIDRMLGRGMRFGIGYALNSDATPLGVNDRTCWWAGWGGSMCVVDVENRMVASYVMNRMADEADLRAALVVLAAHGARADAVC